MGTWQSTAPKPKTRDSSPRATPLWEMTYEERRKLLKGMKCNPLCRDFPSTAKPERDDIEMTPEEAQLATATALRKEPGFLGTGNHVIVELSKEYFLFIQVESPTLFLCAKDACEFRFNPKRIYNDIPLLIFLVDRSTGEVSLDHNAIGPFELDGGLRPKIREWIRDVVKHLAGRDDMDTAWRSAPWPQWTLFDGEFEEPILDGDRSWKNGYYPEYENDIEPYRSEPLVLTPIPRVPAEYAGSR